MSWYLAQHTPCCTGQPPDSNAFPASLGGISLTDLTDLLAQGYTRYSSTAVATGSSAVLRLTAGNDLGQFLLDRVSVVATPAEPSAWKLVLGGALSGLAFGRKRFKRANVVSTK